MQPIYIEASDEITTVIERMKEAENTAVALVIPKGAVLLQSIVNLKLAKKTATDLGKEMVLVTTDKIGKNLAAQVGLPVVARIEDATSGMTAGDTALSAEEGEPHIIDGVKVRRYYEEGTNETSQKAGETAEAAAIAPIIPREILKEQKPAEQPVDQSPITVRKISTDPLPAKKNPTVETILPASAVIASAATPVLASEESSTPISGEAASAVMEETVPSRTEAIAAATSSKAEPSAPKRKRHTPRAIVFALYLILLAFLGAAGVGAFYLPKTEVSIVVASKSWEQDLALSAKPNSSLPTELVSAEITDTVEAKATGKKDVGTPAAGTAKVFNVESSDPKTLPAGSQIVANGITFTTNKEVVVPGARVQGGAVVEGSATVDITAAKAGTEGNMSATTATVPGQKLYAQVVSTTGGTSKEVAVVTQTDITAIKTALIQKLRASAENKLVADLQNRSIYFDAATDSFASEDINVSAIAGAESENITASGKGIIKRLVIDKTAVEETARKQLESTQEQGTTYLTDSVVVNSSTITFADQTASFAVTAKGRSSKSIATDGLAADLAGKKRSDGEELLKSKVTDGKITINQQPDWWPIHNFPYSAAYIEVQVTYE